MTSVLSSLTNPDSIEHDLYQERIKLLSFLVFIQLSRAKGILLVGLMNITKRMYNFQTSRFKLIHSKTPFHCKCEIQLKANSFYWLYCKRNIYTLARTSQQNLIEMNFYVTFLNNIALKIVANSCWFSHDVTKIQTTKLSILPRF